MKSRITNSTINHRVINLWAAALCLLIFVALISEIFNMGIKETDANLSKESDIIYNRLTNELNNSLNVLNGFNAYFHTVDNIDYKHLSEYSSSIRTQYPHIYMIEYMVRVPKSELKNFIQTRKNEGHANYKIMEFSGDDHNKLSPVKDRNVYYPIVFIDPPVVKTTAMLGFDVYSQPAMRQAIDNAIKRDTNVATVPFKLYEGSLGYAVVRPIFTTDGTPQDPKFKQEFATRLVAVIVRIDNLIRNLDLKPRYNMELDYLDTKSNTYKPVYSNHIDTAHNDTILPEYQKQNTLEYAGQTLRLSLKRQLHWDDFSYEWLIFSIIVTAAISLLIFSFIHFRLKSIRERQLAQAELFREKELAEVTLHSIGEAVITTDLEHNIKYMNPVAELLTGWNVDNAINLPLESVFKLVSEDTRSEIDSIIHECLQKNEAVSIDTPTLLISKNGKEYAIENSAAPICDHSNNIVGSVLVFKNVTHIRNMARKMEHQATHDSLTGLINRHEFEHQLKNAIHSARDEGHQHALCYLDLDQFKIVNDTCGHIAGDQLLRELAKLMPTCIRTSDCLARLGGDEFGVLMFDCPLDQAKKVADALRTTVKEFHFTWDKKAFDIGVSIGLVPITKDSGSLQDILRSADSSCYIAKDKGRNRVHVYLPDDYELVKRRGEMQWLTRIQKAIDENHFVLALQSIQALKPVKGLPHKEILLRMLTEDGSIVSPASFIPAAERYDIMATLDRWVIRTAFWMINEEHTSKQPSFVYNINLSGQTLCEPGILDFIHAEIKNFNITASNICFEITETAVIANLSHAIEFITAMKKSGCLFALDDFGSGLSSFNYLKKLPVDYLKIDGEFIKDILTDPVDRAIVSAINNIGHEMGLQTVAEYAENNDIIEILRELGVDHVQGYAIDKPVLWYSDNKQSRLKNAKQVPAPSV
jgi:diguanylate cyclase (GGDEF)-like protein/PAS domain S-box-containing protein